MTVEEVKHTQKY